VTRHKKTEALKTILIVVLIISAIYLGWGSRLFGNSSAEAGSFADLLRALSAEPAGGGAAGSDKAAAAGLPVAIALTGADGSRYGAKYDLSEISSAYGNTSAIFGQALGTAGPPRKTDAAGWRKALGSLGIYYEYMTPVRLSVLGSWYGANISEPWGDMSARRLVVTSEGKENRLFFQDSDSGVFYVSETAALSDISAPTAANGANGALFAYETNADSGAPYTLLISAAHPDLAMKNPLEDKEKLADVLLSLKVSETLQPYAIPGGWEYVGKTYTLELMQDGTVSWTGKGETSGAGPMTQSEAVGLAQEEVSKTVGKYCGTDAGVYYDSSRTPAGGGWTILFRYVAAGGSVWLKPDGYAASVTIKNGEITEMTLCFRSFSISDETPPALPSELQAAAAADGDFMLGYADDGSGLLKPAWVYPAPALKGGGGA
jgi:hypothetical protein